MERWTLFLNILAVLSLGPLLFIDEKYYYIPKFISMIFLLINILYNSVYICNCVGSFFKSCKRLTKSDEMDVNALLRRTKVNVD